MEVELQKTYEAIQEGIDDMNRKWKIKKQRRVKTLPHGYYTDPNVREMYRLMKASVGEYD
tara:strand:- start:79 stop:258 length:180 start_codon:yes stop_codon:yes gene_type:complete